MTALVDLEDVPACLCDEHLDIMAKAMAEGTEESIWSPHENPFLTAHVATITRRMQSIVQAIDDDLSLALKGKPVADMAKAEGPPEAWRQWDADRAASVKAYLEAKPRDSFTLEDWLLLAEFLINKYCPPRVIRSLAEYMTLRASILGKIQASAINLKATPLQMAELVELVPTLFAHVPPRLLTPTENATIRIAKARAGESMALAMDSAGHRMKGIIIEHVQAQVLGQTEGNPQHLATRLFDNFATLNRDFRRIAVTESGECCNQGFIAASLGRRVRRLEAYRGACGFCKGISGKVYNVVSPSDPQKSGDRDVWEGKSNLGRSASTRKRARDKNGNEVLVQRPPGELWWAAAGVQHPHCRGSWTPVADKPPAVSAEFHDWMQKQLMAAIPTYRTPETG